MIKQIDANNEESYIIVLGNRNSVISRGINAAVSVSNIVNNNNRITSIKTSFGSIEINNELVDSKNGYVVEGSNSLDAAKCMESELKKIIISCDGKLTVRNRTTDDAKKFGLF